MDTLGFAAVLIPVLSTATVYDLVDDQNIRGTTVAGLTTSFTSVLAVETAQAKNIDITTQYIESLSDEELAQMEQLLTDKEESIVIEEPVQKVKSL